MKIGEPFHWARETSDGSMNLAPAMAWTGTDIQLLELARRGDTASVAAAIYDLFSADVNRLVWRVLGADAEHDDVVHHVFIQLVTGIANVRDPEAMRVWMASVCIKTVRTEIRRRRLRRISVRTVLMQTEAIHTRIASGSRSFARPVTSWMNTWCTTSSCSASA